MKNLLKNKKGISKSSAILLTMFFIVDNYGHGVGGCGEDGMAGAVVEALTWDKKEFVSVEIVGKE